VTAEGGSQGGELSLAATTRLTGCLVTRGASTGKGSYLFIEL
jgi:hypothetical protein